MIIIDKVIFPALCPTGASLPIGWESLILWRRPFPENPKDSNAEENGHHAQHQSHPQVHIPEREMIDQSLFQRQHMARRHQGHIRIFMWYGWVKKLFKQGNDPEGESLIAHQGQVLCGLWPRMHLRHWLTSPIPMCFSENNMNISRVINLFLVAS